MSIEKGRYVSDHPLPTDHEREILTILIEECAEVQQRATKLLRFGATEIQSNQDLTNVERLSLEIGDLQFMILMAARLKLVDFDRVIEGQWRKQTQLDKFLQTNKEGH